MIDWEAFVRKATAVAPQSHRLRPPCQVAQIAACEADLGRLPMELTKMLNVFNGAELFVDCMPLLTLFGISAPDDPLSNDWYIDRFTKAWRGAGRSQADWVFGITNYGGVLILAENCTVRQWDTAQQTWTNWDTAQKTWTDIDVPLPTWVEQTLVEGEHYMTES